MEPIKTTINIPDPLASNDAKKDKAYGMAYAQIISSEWFNGGMISEGCQFMNRASYVRNKRLFVRGEHNLDYFKKNAKKGDNDLDYINLDWSNINWAEKFCRIVSNGISDKNYKLDVRATDKLSAINKQKQQDFYLKYMKSKKMLGKAKELLGIDVMPKSFIPEDEEEMQILMEIKDRPRIEIAEEILIEYILNTNDWSYLSGVYDKELVDIGLIIARVYTDVNDGVKVAYVDSQNYIHSNVKRNDFADKTYEGVVDTITIHDIVRESNGEFSEEDLRKIAKSYGAYNNNANIQDYSTCGIKDFFSHKINVLRFAFKTSKTIAYKKKIRNGETVKLSKRSDTFKAPIAEDAGELKSTFDTWFEGNYIVGSQFLYGYKECENLYDDIMNKAMSPFITHAYDIYENRLRSFTDNIEAPARQLQKIALKIQHLISELKPDLIEIDLDMLAELDDGKGGSKKETWQTALDILISKGVVFTKRANLGEDGIKDKPGARPYPQQQGSGLSALLNSWAHFYNLIRENTGVNPARDGSTGADSLVGVNQMQQLASNTVTANIVEGSVLFKKRIQEVISTRIHSIFNYSEAHKIREVYEAVVGKGMMDALEVLKNRNLHEFGFTFEMNATSDEIKEFNDLLSNAMADGTIDVEVVFQARQIAKVNFKKASEYLMYHRRKRIKQKQEERMMFDMNKSKSDSMAAQAKVEAETMAYQTKKMADLKYEKQLAAIRTEEYLAKKQIDAPSDEQKFQKDIYLKKLESYVSMEKESFKEDRKDDRTKLQATQQSKMVDQRQRDNGPIDFEQEENWFIPQQ